MTNNNNVKERRASQKMELAGTLIIRYGLVIILLWIGLLKFTSYEAMGVLLYASHSPFIAWAYSIVSVQQWSMVIGIIEIILAILVSIYPIAPRASSIGSWGIVAMALCTLSFLVTTPGVLQSGHGFPFLSRLGQFLLKDLLLLGGGVYTAGRAQRAWRDEKNSYRYNLVFI